MSGVVSPAGRTADAETPGRNRPAVAMAAATGAE